MHKEVQKSYEAVYFCFFKTQCFDWLKNHWKILKLREREREKSKFILEFKKNIKVMVRFKKINTLESKNYMKQKKEKQTKWKERRKMRKASMFCHLFDMYSYSYLVVS